MQKEVIYQPTPSFWFDWPHINQNISGPGSIGEIQSKPSQRLRCLGRFGDLGPDHVSIRDLGSWLQLNLLCSLDLRPLNWNMPLQDFPASLFGLERNEKHHSYGISGPCLPVQSLKEEVQRGARVHFSPTIYRPSGHPFALSTSPLRVYSLRWPEPPSHCFSNTSWSIFLFL